MTKASVQHLACTSEYMPISYHKELFELQVRKVYVHWKKKGVEQRDMEG